MEVTIISKKLVKPASPTPQNLRNLPISCLDQTFPPLYVPIVLFYAPGNGEVGVVEEASHRKRLLDDSLARVLSLYYPLAGRYMSDEYKIDCNDEGVELIEAKVNCNLSEFVNRSPVHELSLLVSHGFLPLTGPLVTIQLNMFDCGGIAIGMSYAHRIMDGCSSSEFIRGWSVSCSQGIDKVQCPSFLLTSVVTPAIDGLIVFPPPHRKKAEEKIVSTRFLFNEEAIRTLKAMANKGDKYSRGQVVIALIWTVLIRACQAKNKGNLRSSLLSIPVDMRDKVKIPIPPISCGNFVFPSLAKFFPRDGKSNVDFAEVVSLLSDSITSTVKQCAEFTRGDDIVTGVVNAFKDSVCDDEDGDTVMVTSWCNMPYYQADFGWGKPIWVSTLPLPLDNFIILLDTKDKSGVEALVSLEEKKMIFFKENLDIKALAITL